MKKFSLNGVWRMEGNGFSCKGIVPGSVYSFLLQNGLMEDPYYRDNELKALELMDHDYTFTKEFTFAASASPVLLHCDGLDTLCDLYLNGAHIAYTDNMHRTYEFDVTTLLKNGKNKLKAVFHSPDAYMKATFEEKPALGAWHCMKGFANLRKAHCMMGWDWGPRLPDAGIFRDIYLLEQDSARIKEVHLLQSHRSGQVFITPQVTVDGTAEVEVLLTAPDGTVTALDANRENEVEDPVLWWPNGLGDQPLYTVTVNLLQDGAAVDTVQKKLGLRELKLIREKDEFGESFCHEVNGVRFFAMGADYIPEDNILSRVTPDRTHTLLQHCRDSHFNAVRVWGGGYYPDDFFFEACDEMGIVVFFDMMFACTRLWVDDAFLQNITQEFYDNLKRIRHHACIAVISGNNEIEDCYKNAFNDRERREYLLLFEKVLPAIVQEVCPYIPYVPSSPSTCGHFIEPNNENYGDCHYWDVWHGNKPFTEYRNKFFRYLSEFGFQSFPCEKTVKAFTLPGDRNIFSRIMEMHQRNNAANGKILTYLSDTFRYPSQFGTLLYASQLLQAQAIRYGVEHLRRNRGRCMGTLYWQLNDIWPVASWASIDYFGRYKALQYFASRFYAPVMISCRETGERDTRKYLTYERCVDYRTAAALTVHNDTKKAVSGVVKWALRDRFGTVLRQGSFSVVVDALSVFHLDELDFEKTDTDSTYFSYAFTVKGKTVSSGTSLFTAPKYFDFADPHLKCAVSGKNITVFSDAYAQSVEIDSPDSDFILSDNYFDMNAGCKTVTVLEGKPKTITLRSVYDIR